MHIPYLRGRSRFKSGGHLPFGKLTTPHHRGPERLRAACMLINPPLVNIRTEAGYIHGRGYWLPSSRLYLRNALVTPNLYTLQICSAFYTRSALTFARQLICFFALFSVRCVSSRVQRAHQTSHVCMGPPTVHIGYTDRRPGGPAGRLSACRISPNGLRYRIALSESRGPPIL